MSREHLAALCRLLIGSGDMTPMAERVLLGAYDEVSGSTADQSSIAPSPTDVPKEARNDR